MGPAIFQVMQSISKTKPVDSEASDLHRKVTGAHNPELEICRNAAGEGFVQFTTRERGTASERASLTNVANKFENKNYMVLMDAYEKEFAIMGVIFFHGGL